MGDLISRAAAIDYLMTNMGWREMHNRDIITGAKMDGEANG